MKWNEYEDTIRHNTLGWETGRDIPNKRAGKLCPQSHKNMYTRPQNKYWKVNHSFVFGLSKAEQIICHSLFQSDIFL
jgi:hypothetical protein